MRTTPYILALFGILFSLTVTAQTAVIKASKISSCDSLHVKFAYEVSPASTTISTYEWDFGNGQTSSSNDPDTVYFYPGKYTVTLKMKSTTNPNIEATTTISIGKTPKAYFTYKDTFYYGSYSIAFFGGIQDTSKYFPYAFHWNINNSETNLQRFVVQAFDTAGTYPATLIVNDAFGCADTTSQSIIVTNTLDLTKTANVFSPNGDGINDEFVIPTNGKDILSFKVFSKSGIKIYETEAKIIRWDGRNSSGTLLSPGMYYYVIEVSTTNPPQKKTGFFYVYR
jgi:gliding motility-associated-like protein